MLTLSFSLPQDKNINLKKKKENLNRTIINKEIKAIVKIFPTKKIPESDGFTGEFYQTFKEDLRSIFLRVFQKNEEERIFSNSFGSQELTS